MRSIDSTPTVLRRLRKHAAEPSLVENLGELAQCVVTRGVARMPRDMLGALGIHSIQRNSLPLASPATCDTRWEARRVAPRRLLTRSLDDFGCRFWL